MPGTKVLSSVNLLSEEDTYKNLNNACKTFSREPRALLKECGIS